MYVRPNYASKKLLEDAVDAGDPIEAFSPDLRLCPSNGIIAVYGPHWPEAHKWFAQVKVEAGRVVKVIS